MSEPLTVIKFSADRHANVRKLFYMVETPTAKLIFEFESDIAMLSYRHIDGALSAPDDYNFIVHNGKVLQIMPKFESEVSRSRPDERH